MPSHSSKPHKYEPYAVAVLGELLKGDPLTLKEIQAVVNAVAVAEGHSKAPGAYSVIYWIRGEIGHHVLVCEGRRNAKYRIADTQDQAFMWIRQRRKNILSQIKRTLKSVQDTMSIFDEAMSASEVHDLMMVQASLSSAMTIMEASLSGGSGSSSAAAATV